MCLFFACLHIFYVWYYEDAGRGKMFFFFFRCVVVPGPVFVIYIKSERASIFRPKFSSISKNFDGLRPKFSAFIWEWVDVVVVTTSHILTCINVFHSVYNLRTILFSILAQRLLLCVFWGKWRWFLFVGLNEEMKSQMKADANGFYGRLHESLIQKIVCAKQRTAECNEEEFREHLSQLEREKEDLRQMVEIVFIFFNWVLTVKVIE